MPWGFARSRLRYQALLPALAAALLPVFADAQSVLRRGTAAESPSLDPSIAAGSLAAPIIADLFEGLIGRDAGLQPVPGAAESWSVSEDGLRYTFSLRPGLLWSDGTPLTASDFVFAYQRVVTPSTASPMAGQFFILRNARAVFAGEKAATELGVHAPDEQTVVIELENPAPWFLQMLVNLIVAPVPRHAIEEHGRAWTRPENMVTNGPYTVAERLPHDYTRLVKNPRYREAAEVRTDEVYWYPTQDLGTSLRRFRAGELHQMLNFPPDEITRLRREMPDSLKIADAQGIYYLALNVDHAPFRDPRVRRALTLAVDRDTIAHRLLRTDVRPAVSLVGPNFPGYEEVRLAGMIRPLPERQAEARRLLAEAGYGPGQPLSFDFVYDTNEENRMLAVALSSMWQAVGVRARLRNVDFGQLRRHMVTGSFEMARWVYFASFEDPYALLSLYGSDNSNNYSGYANPDYDRLLEQSDLSRDPEERLRLLAEAERLLLTDAPVIPIYHYVRRYLVSPDVEGWVTTGRGPTPSRFLSVP